MSWRAAWRAAGGGSRPGPRAMSRSREDVGLKRGPLQIFEFGGVEENLNGPVLTWIVGRAIRAHIHTRGRDPHDILYPGAEGIEIEGRFFCKLVGLIVGCNEGSSNFMLTKPVGSNLNPVLLDHFNSR